MEEEKANISYTADSEVQLAVFFVGGERYAIDIMNIKEIIIPIKMTPIPDVPIFIKGVINLRGMLMPVVSMRERLGMPHEEDDNSRIIIFALKNIVIGIIVDSVDEIITIPLRDIQPPPKIARGLDSKYLKGICRIEDDVLLLLNLQKVLTAVEKVMIDEIKKNDIINQP